MKDFTFPREIGQQDFLKLKGLENERQKMLAKSGGGVSRYYIENIQDFADICDAYGLHPSKVQEALNEGATKSDLEQMERWAYGMKPGLH